MLRDKLKERLANYKLEMSPSKTKIVYCKDRERTEDYPEISSDFLGYTFHPRKSLSKDGELSLNFLPAISGKEAKAIRQTVRDWDLKRKVVISMEEIARRINPIVRGWVVYYGRFYRSSMCRVVEQVDLHLAKWITHKHKRVRGSLAKAYDWLRRIRRTWPRLFAHWDLDYKS